MFPRAVIGLFLALVFQLAQIAPCLAASCTSGPETAQCGCCDKKQDACPCASNKTERERSTPIAPPAPEVKAHLALPSVDPVAPQATLAEAAAPRGSPDSPGERTAGYAGVTLAVAFCSFLI
ncbi:hypothetical protein KBB96_06235 [Luteolibacter ambystomatis]|uniref:Uncharacterized protein n=1 Tax=Luteolibacter ambystomatis TaxID=2824561 RepID=A0A975J1V5_9BACT|nr:hypothetical protein [Luteolibacter ambystomatis]QUE52488.1 hypothetical protein KBB96_06235 [Luteolibacter ambystomatis]